MKRIRGFGKKLLTYAQRAARHKAENVLLGMRLRGMIDRGEKSCGGTCLCTIDCPFRKNKSAEALQLTMEVVEDVKCGIYSTSVRAVVRRLEFHKHRDRKLPADATRLERTLARRLSCGVMTSRPVSMWRAVLNQFRELRRSDS